MIDTGIDYYISVGVLDDIDDNILRYALQRTFECEGLELQRYPVHKFGLILGYSRFIASRDC